LTFSKNQYNMVLVKTLFNKLWLYFYPPKKGDSFIGDPLRFVIARPVEYVLHGLKDKNGNTTWEPIPSFGCYILTIENDQMPYYVCKSEVLCGNDSIKLWNERSQPKRFGKKMFKDMIATGVLKKETT
jgi:hypothetical protein